MAKKTLESVDHYNEQAVSCRKLAAATDLENERARGPRVRLAGSAAREIDGTCSAGDPCPVSSAEAARDGLARLVGKPIGRSREGHVLVLGLPFAMP